MSVKSSAGRFYLRHKIAEGADGGFKVFDQIRLRWPKIDL